MPSPPLHLLLQALRSFQRDETGYQKIQGTKPQTLAYALTVRLKKQNQLASSIGSASLLCYMYNCLLLLEGDVVAIPWYAVLRAV
jgi:hypothetical protein